MSEHRTQIIIDLLRNEVANLNDQRLTLQAEVVMLTNALHAAQHDAVEKSSDDTAEKTVDTH